MIPLYKEVVVWRRDGDGEAVRYTCLQDLANDLVCVLAADFLRTPVAEDDLRAAERERVDALIEDDPGLRQWRASVIEAVAAHDAAFQAALDDPGCGVDPAVS